MSKRKRASLGKTTPESEQSGSTGEESTDEGSKEDMVHVTSDLLAGSPEIFASKRKEAASTEPEVVTEPIQSEPVAPSAPAVDEVAPAEPDHAPAHPIAVATPEPPTLPPPPAPPRPLRRHTRPTAPPSTQLFLT